ncbi:hypothetical protein FHN55_17005 [Streptomyces sp. NP160]|nr:hypothetical protein FHN55_17005 [Streptomyces sp. NP160]
MKGDTGTAGAKGDTGDTGPAGPGVAAGGTTNQFLIKSSSTNYATTWSSKLNAVYTGTASGDHTIAAIQNATAGDNISALNVSSINEQFSSMQVTGREIDTGTIKVSHVKPASGTSDANAAALSIDLKGTGTAAQGIVIDATEGGTTGDLLKLRNNGAFLVTVKSDGKMGIGTGLNTPGGKLEVRQTDDSLPGVVIQANSTTSADLLQFKNNSGALRTNINRTGDLVVRGQAYLQNLQVVGTSTDFGGGNGVIGLKNANTVPTTNPTGGVIVYSDAGVLKYRQPDGTVIDVGSNTAAALNYNATSSSSVTIGTGSKTFTVASGLAFAAGNYVRVQSTANATTYMAGNVTSYSGTSLVINVVETSGTGTLGSWTIGLTGAKGAAGSTGSAGTVLTSTSSTSNAIGTGSKTFTTAAAMTGATVGQWVLITNTGTPANFMRGQVTALSGTSITINVTEAGGSGTFTAWTLSVTGMTGAQGVQGPAGTGSDYANTFVDVNRVTTTAFPNNGFAVLPLNNEVSDVGNNYDATTYLYTVPTSGLYMCLGDFRLRDDEGTTGASVGIGIHTAAEDGPHFKWTIIPASQRRYIDYRRMARFNAGDQLRLFVYYGDAACTLERASMQIVRLS